MIYNIIIDSILLLFYYKFINYYNLYSDSYQ